MNPQTIHTYSCSNGRKEKHIRSVSLCALVILSLMCFPGLLFADFAGVSGPTSPEEANVTARRITESIVESVTQDSYDTPIRTCEAFFAAIVRGDFRQYFNCLSEQLIKDMSGDKDVSEERIRELNEKFKQAGFKNAILHSLTLNLDKDKPAITLVASSERDGMRVKGQLDIELDDTEHGWKIVKMDSTTVDRVKSQDAR